MPGFAVLDLETTGLSPRLGDRIAEAAVVLVDERGAVEDEWCTLVNPGRDLGPQHVHGIAAADVALAPPFRDVAPDLLRLLEGRVLVAHNAAFDTRFLRAELGRAGVVAAIDPVACLCTQQLAGRYLTGSRGLAACCAAVGVVHDGVHSALGDARATAGLLGHFLDVARDDDCWASARLAADGVRWTLPASLAVEPVLRGASRRHGHWLAALDTPPPGIRPTTPTADASAPGTEYLRVLDLALLDGYVSHAERAALLDVARRSGLDRDAVERLHRDHLAALARDLLDDGPDEPAVVEALAAHPVLHEAAGQLGLDADDVAAAAHAALGARLVDEASPAVGQRSRFTLAGGDEVVLTGSMRRTRAAWEDAVRGAGLAPWPHVTRRTRLVVAADPDTLSTKARTARRYGIPVVTEDAFERLLTGVSRSA
ncbi:exonuclease domain-containing protein [Cellulosimicrobium marinum]|uniref:exonuclease domain-containing protein n=1 Tax=Cellulosimicrobium marinum TaxID=1638992 RepID=UPI001E2D4773|nr:exonuclease domain-containing protein [Cellulosimicrobium marinum]MCB7136064.1 DNA polymerase III subunit epsilon [Cellulosimicrobium marinum]